MTEYIKIPNIYKREEGNPKKNNPLIIGEYSSPELEYLAGCEWVWTEKVDGTNVRVIWDGHRVSYMGRTDRAELPQPLRERLVQLFDGPDKEELFEQTFGDTPVILFGEGFGGRIQTAGPKYGDVDFILFDMLTGCQTGMGPSFAYGRYASRLTVEEVAGVFGVRVVPIVGSGTLYKAVEYIKSGPDSQLGELDMEGVVCRPEVELCDRGGKRIIVKIKERDFR